MDKNKELDLRMDRHQAYVSRQWQVFGAFLLLQGLLINAAKDLLNTPAIVFGGLTLCVILTTVIFFHLIAWLKVRIEINAQAINSLIGKEFIELQFSQNNQGITLWLSLAMLVFCLFWLSMLYSAAGWPYVLGATIAGIALLIVSTYSRKTLLCNSANK